MYWTNYIKVDYKFHIAYMIASLEVRIGRYAYGDVFGKKLLKYLICPVNWSICPVCFIIMTLFTQTAVVTENTRLWFRDYVNEVDQLNAMCCRTIYWKKNILWGLDHTCKNHCYSMSCRDVKQIWSARKPLWRDYALFSYLNCLRNTSSW